MRTRILSRVYIIFFAAAVVASSVVFSAACAGDSARDLSREIKPFDTVANHVRVNQV